MYIHNRKRAFLFVIDRTRTVASIREFLDTVADCFARFNYSMLANGNHRVAVAKLLLGNTSTKDKYFTLTEPDLDTSEFVSINELVGPRKPLKSSYETFRKIVSQNKYRHYQKHMFYFTPNKLTAEEKEDLESIVGRNGVVKIIDMEGDHYFADIDREYIYPEKPLMSSRVFEGTISMGDDLNLSFQAYGYNTVINSCLPSKSAKYIQLTEFGGKRNRFAETMITLLRPIKQFFIQKTRHELSMEEVEGDSLTKAFRYNSGWYRHAPDNRHIVQDQQITVLSTLHADNLIVHNLKSKAMTIIPNDTSRKNTFIFDMFYDSLVKLQLVAIVSLVKRNTNEQKIAVMMPKGVYGKSDIDCDGFELKELFVIELLTRDDLNFDVEWKTIDFQLKESTRVSAQKYVESLLLDDNYGYDVFNPTIEWQKRCLEFQAVYGLGIPRRDPKLSEWEKPVSADVERAQVTD